MSASEAGALIAVTAASGRLGHAVLAHLIAQRGPAGLLGIARDPARIHVDGIQRRAGDYASPEGMSAALRGVDTAVMISAPVTPGVDRLALHRNVIDAARQVGLRQLVYTSVIGNGKEAGTWYAATQQVNRDTERALASSGLEWVIARNALYLDLDLEHILRAANGDGIYRNNGGEGRCGYMSIDELAFAIARLATTPGHAGKIYNLCGEPMSQAELVAAACEVFDITLRYETMSAEDNVTRLMSVPRIAARGEAVARMLSGCFQCIERGAFDVPSHYAAAAGREPKSIREQMRTLRASMSA